MLFQRDENIEHSLTIGYKKEHSVEKMFGKFKIRQNRNVLEYKLEETSWKLGLKIYIGRRDGLRINPGCPKCRYGKKKIIQEVI